jgi:hypothetical protein
VGQALEAIGGEEEGGVTGAIAQLTSGVVIAMLIAVGITVILLFIANVSTDLGIFPAGTNPFVSIYNGVRNLTLFIMLFPIFLPLLVTAFVLDLVVDVGFPIIENILQALFDFFGTGINIDLPDPADIDIMAIATTLTKTIEDLVKSLFPPLEY